MGLAVVAEVVEETIGCDVVNKNTFGVTLREQGMFLILTSAIISLSTGAQSCSDGACYDNEVELPGFGEDLVNIQGTDHLGFCNHLLILKRHVAEKAITQHGCSIDNTTDGEIFVNLLESVQ